MIVANSLRLYEVAGASEDIFAIFSEVATVLFLIFLLFLIVVRRPAIVKAQGFLPRAAALAGMSLPVLFAALPKATLTPAMTTFSSITILIGVGLSMVSAFWLGRSFGILPQARALVTDGPYGIIRHPLYLAELLVVFGTMCRFEQPLSFCIMILVIAAQIPRMHYEEQILIEAFPTYRDYANRTARLIPRLY